MEFKKYSEIDNSYRTKLIDFIREHGYDDKKYEWTVSEKIDGSNISFWISDADIKVARRTDFLDPDENFYNYQSVLAKYKDYFSNIKKLWFKDSLYIVIYGELFGGVYKHPDVPKIPTAVKVQARIQYCPHNDFYPFDIYVVNEDAKSYIPHRDVERVFADGELPYAESLFRGTFDECMAYNIDFPTAIPAFFNLPPIENNNAEGIVIKPELPLYFRTGDRVILKHKVKDFMEIECPDIKLPEVLPPEVEQAKELIVRYVTESRYHSVVSKLGEVTIKQFGTVMKEYTTDVMNDFLKDFPEYNELPKEMQKKVTKVLGKAAADLIRRLL